MALIKCRECGKEISEKADRCPHCGAKPSNGHIPGGKTMLVIGGIVAIYWYSNKDNITSPPPPRKSAPIEKIEKPVTSWTSFTRKDEMTGEVSYVASSQASSSTTPMTAPYSDIKAWLGFVCLKKDKAVYLSFSDSPNLTSRSVKNGYSWVFSRIKWDDVLEDVDFRHEFGSNTLYFEKPDEALEKLKTSKTALIELSWYRQGRVHFSFSLEDSAKQINEASKNCLKTNI